VVPPVSAADAPDAVSGGFISILRSNVPGGAVQRSIVRGSRAGLSQAVLMMVGPVCSARKGRPLLDASYFRRAPICGGLELRDRRPRPCVTLVSRFSLAAGCWPLRYGAAITRAAEDRALGDRHDPPCRRSKLLLAQLGAWALPFVVRAELSARQYTPPAVGPGAVLCAIGSSTPRKLALYLVQTECDLCQLCCASQGRGWPLLRRPALAS